MATIRKKAVVSADHRLHLDVDVPETIPVGEVEITVLMKPAGTPDPETAAACLREVARRGNLKQGPDPVEWQRRIRADRLLPGRD